MGPVRRWIERGLAPPDIDAERYGRIVRVLAVVRMGLLFVAVGAVFLFADEFIGGTKRFLLAIAGVYLPFVVLQTWAGTRPRLGPWARGIILALDVGVVTFFVWLFPDLRILAPYAYLYVVVFTAAMTGTAGGLAASVFVVVGSFVAWPVELAEPFHRAAFIGMVFAIAILVDGIGRERNQATRVARESESRMNEAQSLAHVGSWYWNLRDDVVTSSNELFRIFGYEEFDTTGSFAGILYHTHPDDRRRLLVTLGEAIASADTFEIEYRIVRTTGEVRTLHTRGRVIRDAAGEAVATMGSGQDVTEQREMEEAMRYALELEREASEHLRSVNEMKNAFLTAVSHELRTPLTAVLGFAQTLESRDDLSAPQRTDLLRRLAVNAEKLESLLSDLLDIDRLERGILVPNRRRTELSALVRRTVEESGMQSERSISLDLVPVVIEVDPPKVERIVENLLANAVKHTPVGTRIWVRLGSHPDGALLTVEDAGPGVPPEARTEIFAPFRQGPVDHSPGVGIGLSLVERFAELHGGRVWVEDRPGGGARFCVLLASTGSDGEEIQISPAIPDAVAREV